MIPPALFFLTPSLGTELMPFACRWSALTGPTATMWLVTLLLSLPLTIPVRADELAGLPKVPPGFEIRLLARVPTVTYACQIATRPDGALFVAEDPMDQVGPSNQPIDRILLFREGQEPIVFADKMNAVFGMAWHEGALYVMHMPYLSILRDTRRRRPG